MQTFLRFCFSWVLLSCMATVFAQTNVLVEDFESGALPTNWSRSQATPSAGWEFGTAGQMTSSFFAVPTTNATKIATSNDDKHDNNAATANNASVDRLITPYLDLTPYTTLFLEFESYQPGSYGSTGTVEVSTDSGATWSNIFTVPESGVWEDILINISIFNTASDLLIAFRHNDGGLWADGFSIDNVRIFEPATYDAGVTALTMNSYYETGAVNVTGTLQNLGAQSISSVDLSYSLDGGAPVTTSLTGLVVLPGTSYSFSHPTAANLPLAVGYDLRVWTSNVNGNADDNPANDTLSSALSAVSSIPVKNVVIEDHTGAWCQFCPDGTATINNIVNTFSNAIAVSVHNGDAMSTASGNQIEAAFDGGFPKSVVDHYKFEEFPTIATSSRSQWSNRVQIRSQHIVPISVSFERVGWDAATRTMSAVINTSFVGEVMEEVRMNLWILEDSVTGSGSGYNQVNYYNTVAGHPFQGAGNPIIGFVHDYTLRETIGGAWGIPNSLPPSGLADGQSYQFRFDQVLSGNFDEKHIRLVAMVQQYDALDVEKRQIYNAAWIELPLAPLPPPTGIDEDAFAAKVLNVYPNPFSDRVAVEFSLPKTGAVDIRVMDLFGREIAQLAKGTMAQGINTTFWDGRTQTGGSVPNGVYLIRIETQGVATYHKVNLSR